MTLEEMKTLSDAYKLEQRSRKREPQPAVQEKVRFVCVCVCVLASIHGGGGLAGFAPVSFLSWGFPLPPSLSTDLANHARTIRDSRT